MKKLLLIAIACCVCFSNLSADYIKWAGSPTTIPSGADIYYINDSRTLSSTLTVNGVLEIWSGGSLNVGANNLKNNNTITVKTGGSITVPSSGYFDNSETGNGTINVSGGTITIQSGAFFRNAVAASTTGTINLSSGTIDIQSGATLHNADNTSTTGTINISGGTLNANGLNFKNGNAASAIATVNLSGGTLNFGGASFINAITSSTVTSNINISGGTFNQTAGTFFNAMVSGGTGNVTISSGSYNMSGSSSFSNAFGVNSTGNLTILNGTFTLSEGTFTNAQSSGSTGNLVVSGGTFEVSGGTFRNTNNTSGNIIVNGGIFKLSGGTIQNGFASSTTGNITITSGVFYISSGTIENAYGTSSIGNITVSNQAQFKLGSGSITAGVGTNNITIFNHDFSSSGISSGTMTVGSTLTIPTRAGLHIDSGGTLDNDGTIVINGQLSLLGGTIDNAGGTITNNKIFLKDSGGTYVDPAPSGGTTYDTAAANNVIPAESVLIIPDGYTLSISDGQTLFANGVISNQSSSSIDIYGTVYTYSTLENGTTGIPGTLNVQQDGKLVLKSGNLVNRHASSAININSGGELDNFYGNIDITNGSLTLASGGNFTNVRGSDPGTFTNNNGLYFNTTKVILADDLDIDYTWTITEKATIHGNHNKINFGTNGAIVIYGPDASLLLKDVIVDNISGNQIRCTDNTTTLSIDNVTWIQDANYSFTIGQIYINNNWLIKGTGTSFAYQTNQTSTINSNATLELRDTSFNYDTATSNTLLKMIDSKSAIHLDNATFLATQACTLLNGTMFISGPSVANGSSQLDLRSLSSIESVGGLTRVGSVLVL
jgi:adhesin HecA-like repeat protein